MSLQFSDTSNYQGIIQRIEDHCGFTIGTISGNTDLFKRFTAKVNVAQNKVWGIVLQAAGWKWQWDDNNHSKDPIIYTNLVQGQKDYHFSTDEQGNVILDIYRVGILPSAAATLYQDIYTIDAQSDRENGLTSDSTVQGVPYQYDKTGLGIFLDPPPSYNATNGLKAYIDREGYYFTTADTTKTPGFAGIFHEYLALAPSYEYARDKGLASADRLFRDMNLMEAQIPIYYGRRAKDERNILSGEITPFV